MLEFSLFGISYTGADICGFFNEPTYEMCLRWMQLGAFYPYSRNHNGKGSRRQDPLAWDEKFQDASRDVLNIRYTLLPYLYTLMYEAHSQGSTVIRPVLHEFVNDRTTWDVHRQFLWGPALLISPALDMDSYVVHAYIPSARWYNYHTGEAIGVRGQWLDIPTPLEQINLHVRGGYIIPWQDPSNTTAYSRENFMGLTVAMDDNGFAQGSLFWDDGSSIDTYEKGNYYLATFTVNKNTLVTNVQHNSVNSTADKLRLGYIKVWGGGNLQVQEVTAVYNSVSEPIASFVHNVTNQELVIYVTNKAYFMDKPIQVTWKTKLQ
ncbi:MGAL glucoamylase, partial [Polyodon spathula]|nr:MGAL glucoamylase [Polyodon spathula]